MVAYAVRLKTWKSGEVEGRDRQKLEEQKGTEQGAKVQKRGEN